MKKITLSQTSYLLLFGEENQKTVMVSPASMNPLGVPKKYPKKAIEYLTPFCYDLAESGFRVVFLVATGQDSENGAGGLYSYTNTLADITSAIKWVGIGELYGVFGICTGGPIAMKALTNLNLQTKICLYGASTTVLWNTERGQNIFLERFSHIRLDCKELSSAPQTGELVRQNLGAASELLQVVVGESYYPMKKQFELGTLVPNIKQITFPDFSDIPNIEEQGYQEFLRKIVEFFN